MTLKPEVFYQLSCESSKDALTQENFREILSRFNDELSPLFSLYTFSLLPTGLFLLIRSTGETDWESYFRSKDLIQKGYNVFEEAGGALLMGTLAQNKLSGVVRIYLPKDKITIEEVSADAFADAVKNIHFQPVEKGITTTVSDWTFSSYNAFLSDKQTKLPRQAVLDLIGGIEAFVELHRKA